MNASSRANLTLQIGRGTPETQPPLESVNNARQIAQLWDDFGPAPASGGKRPFGDIDRLLVDALSKLGEPHPSTVELTRRYLEAACGRSVDDREARDLAMVVITSALKWEAP